MLGDREVVAMVAVRDMAKATPFYEGVLGLPLLSKQGEELVTYRCGGSKLTVYRSAFAGTNEATCALWDVGSDIADIAGALAGKGVKFERYDMPDLRLEGDVHVGGGMKVAWFKDPDGNILSLVGT